MQSTASFALVGDLIGPHKDLVPKMAACVKELTERWPTTWLLDPSLSHKDQRISAALHTPRHAFDFLVALNLALWPAQCRLAIASGALGKHEGQAFQRALTCLNRAQKEGLLFAIHLPSLPKTSQTLLESSVRLHADIMQDWKPSRQAASSTIRKVRTQQDAAASLGIRQQSISEALRAAHAKHLESLEDAVRLYLSEVSA
ncbi:MAG: hypothetical protein QM477_10400 [Planctomycetota bacterium]